MSPSNGMNSLDQLTPELDVLVARLNREVRQIAEQWRQLRRLGATRDDHAAALLANLIPHFAAIAAFATLRESVIRELLKDPFGGD